MGLHGAGRHKEALDALARRAALFTDQASGNVTWSARPSTVHLLVGGPRPRW